MKQFIFKSLMWVAMCASLFSFSKIGGDSYSIQLNEKQILQHYVHSKAPTPSFSLNQSSPNDQLAVYYSECGKIGKERKLSIWDEKDNVLKEWQFTNVTGEHTPMNLKAKDILAMKQKGSNKLKLVYSSLEVTKGRVLATIEVTDSPKARK